MTACPVCHSPDRTEYVRFEAALQFDHCRACDTVYKAFEAPEVRPDAALYEGVYHVRHRGKRWAHRVRKASRQIIDASQFRNVESFLDVGCSVGYMIAAAEKLGMQGAGTDISHDAVAAARSRGLDARHGELEAIPFDDQSFDLVSLRHVLEHTAYPERALAEVRRVLRPGGLALIAVPDLHYWKGDRQRMTYRYFRPDDLGRQHYVYYSELSLERLLEQHGFHVLSRSKAIYRARLAEKSPAHAAWEKLRHLIVRLSCALTRRLRMRRELWFVAQLGELPRLSS
ncbi:MAG TPA: class I SAM-dependent methyltransferase [Myxococcaceae bacterium]|nr:class I SAM-dependent methyltransferase [Myxococcaceae bacterium]